MRPDLHRAIIDGKADAKNLGRDISGIDMRTDNLQVGSRTGLTVIIEIGHGGSPLHAIPAPGNGMRWRPGSKSDLVVQFFF